MKAIPSSRYSSIILKYSTKFMNSSARAPLKTQLTSIKTLRNLCSYADYSRFCKYQLPKMNWSSVTNNAQKMKQCGASIVEAKKKLRILTSVAVKVTCHYFLSPPITKAINSETKLLRLQCFVANLRHLSLFSTLKTWKNFSNNTAQF